MNKTIVNRIRLTRIEMGITQRDLAAYLGKTPAAISELERQKVQVSASDLYKIAVFLKKPIEFFFGIDSIDNELQTLLFQIRQLDVDKRKQLINSLLLILKIQKAGEVIKAENDDEILNNLAIEYYPLLVNYVRWANYQTKQVNEIKNKLSKYTKLDPP